MDQIQLAWGVTFVSIVVLFIWRGNLVHFTWWSLLWTLFYAFLALLKKEFNYLWFFLTIQIMVIGGVMIMSFTECKLFGDTEEETGDVLYFFGNFAMHYLPLLLALGLTRNNVWTRSLTWDLSDIFTATGLLIVYTGIYDPTDVYSCSFDLSVFRLSIFGGLFLILGIRLIPLLF